MAFESTGFIPDPAHEAIQEASREFDQISRETTSHSDLVLENEFTPEDIGVWRAAGLRFRQFWTKHAEDVNSKLPETYYTHDIPTLEGLLAGELGVCWHNGIAATFPDEFAPNGVVTRGALTYDLSVIERKMAQEPELFALPAYQLNTPEQVVTWLLTHTESPHFQYLNRYLEGVPLAAIQREFEVKHTLLEEVLPPLLDLVAKTFPDFAPALQQALAGKLTPEQKPFIPYFQNFLLGYLREHKNELRLDDHDIEAVLRPQVEYRFTARSYEEILFNTAWTDYGADQTESEKTLRRLDKAAGEVTRSSMEGYFPGLSQYDDGRSFREKQWDYPYEPRVSEPVDEKSAS